MSRERARGLRAEATIPEQILWARLRACRLAGLKFRRQHPLGRYIVDFYCAEQSLVLELDGESHDLRQRYDKRRDAWLVAQGLRVVRIGNDDVLQNLDGVLTHILMECGIDPDAGRPSP